jgi:hypothetical protein
MSNIQWERHTGGNSATWQLRDYRTYADRPYSVVLGSARKVKNKHRCRMWVVTYAGRSYPEHLATLEDMKQPEALDAARLLIMVRHSS